jgi:uroporphyrinogen-III synthase
MQSSDATPLAGRRIVITRTRAQASALAERLAGLGAETILIPTIEIAPPGSWCALDAALCRLRSFNWTIFTSANAVRAFHGRASHLGLHPQPRRIAIIGPATAREAAACGLTVGLMPERFIAEALAEALVPYAKGSAMLLVRAAEARDLLPDALTAGGADVTVAEGYRNIVPAGSGEAVRLALEAVPDAVTFTSSSTAANFFALLESVGMKLDPRIMIASIGPITSATLRGLGHPPHVEARESTVDALVEALASCRFRAKA